MVHPLGRWAAIDLETTGLDSSYDSIIDVGFLQFEGLTLVNKYSSLVKPDDLSQMSFFVQKLTGITPRQLKKAPSWESVEKDVQDLQGHQLLAYNADFEKSFLEKTFASIENEKDEFEQKTTFIDGLEFLPLLNPQAPQFKLEYFITQWQLRDKELHRGLDDSLDLVKVLLLAVKKIRQDRQRSQFLHFVFQRYGMADSWFYHFLSLQNEDLLKLAGQLDFDLEGALEKSEIHEEESNFVPVAKDCTFTLTNGRCHSSGRKYPSDF